MADRFPKTLPERHRRFLTDAVAVVLGPLALMRAGARPAGVRRLERLPPEHVGSLPATVSGLSREETLRALRASVAAYVSVQPKDPALVFRSDAERA